MIRRRLSQNSLISPVPANSGIAPSCIDSNVLWTPKEEATWLHTLAEMTGGSAWIGAPIDLLPLEEFVVEGPGRTFRNTPTFLQVLIEGLIRSGVTRFMLSFMNRKFELIARK